MKTYQLLLPIFKQGDDLHFCIKHTKTLHEAFMKQAKAYQECYNIFTLFATFIKAHPEISVTADTHEIWIEAPPRLMKEWVEMGLVEEEVNWNDPKNNAN